MADGYRVKSMLVRLLVLLLSFCAPPANAATVPEDAEAVSLTADLVWSMGTAETPEAMARRFAQGAFAPGLEVGQLEANHAPERWAAVSVETPVVRRGSFLVRAPVASEVDLYVLRDGLIEPVLSHSLFRPFDPRAQAGGRLISAPVGLDPGTPTLVLAHVKFGPFHQFALDFETPAATLLAAQREIGLTAAFYGLSLACLLVFLALFAAFRDWLSVFYALLFLLGLAFVAVLDGLLFRWLYPNRPELQSAIGFGVLFALSGSGYALAAYGFFAAGRKIWLRVCLGGCVLCAAGLLAALAEPGPFAAMLGNGLLIGSILAAVFGTRAWELSQEALQRFSAALTLAAAAAIVGAVVAFGVRGGVWSLDALTTLKLVYALLLLATLVKSAAQVVALRRAHDQAQTARIAVLERETALNAALLEAEQNHARAREQAELRRRQLASASHDLRQPLTSLRLTMDSLAAQINGSMRDSLKEAFDYVTRLSEQYLDDAGPDPKPAPKAEDPYEIALVQRTVRQMFAEEAAAQGVRLRIVPSATLIDVPPMALMRITANLVSNALNATETGGVLIGVRRRPDGPVLMVCDTGPGLSQDDLDRYRHEGARGAESEGHGIGLAVCFALAAEHGLSLGATSVAGRGTCFALSLSVPNEGSPP